jgi:hypothetical protein
MSTFPPPIYKDNRRLPVPPNNQSAYNPNTNDLTIPETREVSALLGVSSPAGNYQINSVRAPRLVGDELYVQGNSYLQGPIVTNLILSRSLLLPDGTPGSPSLAFQSDPLTGLYGPAGGQVGFTSGGVQQVVIGGGELNTNVPITTPGGQNLILNPSGPSIDCTGHTLVNVAGIVTNPNYYTVIGQITTINATPTAAVTLSTITNAAYTIECAITFTNQNDLVSCGSFVVMSRAKNIGGVVTVVTPYVDLIANNDLTLAGTTVAFAASGTNIVVNVTGLVATTINWTTSVVVTRQPF